MPFDGNTVEFEEPIDVEVSESEPQTCLPGWLYALIALACVGIITVLAWLAWPTPSPVSAPTHAEPPQQLIRQSADGTYCLMEDSGGTLSAGPCGGRGAGRAGPAEAFAIEEDTYYDANGGIIRHDRDVFWTGRTSCGDQDCPGPAGHTSGNFINIDSNGTPQWVVSSSSSGPITYTSGQQLSGGVVAIGGLDVRSLTVLGQQIDLPPNALLTFDGNGNAVISLLHYDPQPTITWHGVKETFYDAAGFPLRSTTNVHFYNGEYCHPGYQSSAGAPAVGRMPNT
jgi:hypothetical protein